MIREAKMLKENPNPYIIEYYDYFTEGINTFIVTEYCDVFQNYIINSINFLIIFKNVLKK